MPTILTDGTNNADIARRLLEAAGDRGDLVQLQTGGVRSGFSVPDDIAIAAGFMEAPKAAAKSDTEDGEPKKAPAKRAQPAAK